VTKPTEPQDSNRPSRSSRPDGDGGASETADVPHTNGATRPESAASSSELVEKKPSLADAATVQAAVPPTEPKINGNGRAMRLPPPWQRVPAGPSTGERSAAAEGSSSGDLSSARTVSMSSDPPTTQMRVSAPAASEPDEGMTAPGGFPMTWPRNRRPRQAALQLKRLDPWSVLKVALVLAVVLYLVWLVAVGMLYGVLDGIGVWDRLNGQYADLVSEQGGDQLISAGRVFGVAAVLGAVNSLLFAVALSVGAFVYNVSADLVGGVEVTLSERD
jgi:hypothetical protein